MTVEATTRLAIDEAAADVLFRKARTPRAYTNEPIDAATLEHIYELAKLGPSALNAQPLRVTWVSAESRDRLVAGVSDGNKDRVKNAAAVAVLSYDVDWTEHFTEVFPNAEAMLPMFAEESARAGFGNNNAWLQAGYFIMAVRAVGLDAGPMSGINTAAIDAEFNADNNQRSFMVVVVDRQDGEHPYERLPRLDSAVAVRTV